MVVKKYHVVVAIVSHVTDILLTLIAIYLTNSILSWTSPVPLISSNSLPLTRTAYIIAVLTWIICAQITNLYDSKRATGFIDELVLLTRHIVLFWISFITLLYLINSIVLLRIPLLYFGIIDLLLLFCSRVILRLVLRYIRKRGYNLKKALVIGASPLGQKVARAIQEHPWAGYVIVGFLDDNPDLAGQRILNLPVLGGLDKIHSVVENMGPDDEVFIVLSTGMYTHVSEVVHDIEDLPINIHVIPDIGTIAYIQPQVEDLWGIPVIGIRRPVIVGPQAYIKRVIDIIGAFLGFLIFSPLMLVAAILIRLDSPGPALFIQERVGENGRIFKIYKFRTMVLESEVLLDQLINIDELEEPVFKLKDDPRVTRIGRLLRRTSIDELPQLFNVLIGEMSLVGPRPEELQLVMRYSSWHRKRLMMKPGLTGPVQVNGRGDLNLRTRVQLEVDYIENYSLLMDFKILLRTIPAVIRGNGSY